MQAPPFAGYVICATPRSGSTLLCRLLAATGRTGKPNSYYHRAATMREWATEWGLSSDETMPRVDVDRAYLSSVLRIGTAGTGIFGLRLHREYADLLSETLGRLFPGHASDARRFEAAFGNLLYIHLSRRDKVAQAVSLVKAEQSGLWHIAPDGTELERLSAPQPLHYDFERIHREVCTLEAWDREWLAWFAAQRIEPMRIAYDTLSDDPGGTLTSICIALGVAAMSNLSLPSLSSLSPGVARLSDGQSREWIERYHADIGAVAQRPV
jgi:trehalose 2-sulfotransferase